MQDDVKLKIIENNKTINRLLLENEQLVKSKGLKPPSSNYALDNKERLKIPSGYIRTSDLFNSKYYLDLIVTEKKVKKNIAYSLQFSDFHNYLLNRFDVWGSVGTILYKHDFINLISIIESLILESASNLSEQCKSRNCKEMSKCKKHVNKNQKNYIREAIDKLYDLGILQYGKKEIERLKELIDFRNRIHIRLAEGNEFLDDKFNLALHNETIKILLEIVEMLKDNAVPFYSKCIVASQSESGVNW